MKRNHNWRKLLKSIPAGLTYSEVARRLGTKYFDTREAILKYRYKAVDGRRYGQLRHRKFDLSRVDWKLPNVDIARQFGVSRELIRLRRRALGKPFVESRGRKVKA